ncbi:hypothetical protein NKH18_24630 [Streptomyces sp. M10(2022)]
MAPSLRPRPGFCPWRGTATRPSRAVGGRGLAGGGAPLLGQESCCDCLSTSSSRNSSPPASSTPDWSRSPTAPSRRGQSCCGRASPCWRYGSAGAVPESLCGAGSSPCWGSSPGRSTPAWTTSPSSSPTDRAEAAARFVGETYGAFHIFSALNVAIMGGWLLLAAGAWRARVLGPVRASALAATAALPLGVLKGTTPLSVAAVAGLCLALVPLGVTVLRDGPAPGRATVLRWTLTVAAVLALMTLVGQAG